MDKQIFKVGDRVKHKKFGLGVIKNIDAKKIYVQYVDGVKEMAIILADKLLTKFEQKGKYEKKNFKKYSRI